MAKQREAVQDMHHRRLLLVSAAIQQGYRIFEDDGLWWVQQPSRPRRPSIVLGPYASVERAQMAAALFAQQWTTEQERRAERRKARMLDKIRGQRQ